MNHFCINGSKNAKVHFENASWVTWLLQSRTLLSVCRVSFLRWFWEPCNYVSVMRERVRVGLSWQRLQLLLTKRETSKESHACSWHRCYSGITQVLIGGNLSGPGKCVFKTMAVVFWQRPCTATCSTTRWSTSSLPSAGWTTSWWGSCHYAAQSDCGTPTRYTHTHACTRPPHCVDAMCKV